MANAPTDKLNRLLDGTGLFVRGGFAPSPEDRLPPLQDERPVRSVLLVGNAGNALWRAFRRDVPEFTEPHPLNRWVMRTLSRAADAVGAEVLDPMRPPYPPIQQWAARAEGVHQSPLGLMIHARYGLWHVYRGALLFGEAFDLPAAAGAPSPCDTCANKPCLNACPVDAFRPSFSPETCVEHVSSPAGAPCQTRGCLSRRACPVGRDWAYDLEPAAYHMGAVVDAVEAGHHKR